MAVKTPSRVLGYGRQTIEQDDIDAVVATLKGDYLTQGPNVAAFEEALAQKVGAKYAVAVSSATAALHIACLAAGVKEGVIGVTQPITFIASANCFLYANGDFDLVDGDPETLMMSPEKLAVKLSERPEVKVIVPVSFSGLSTNMKAIREVSGDRIIIEDASHSFGAKDEEGNYVGMGKYADMTIFSFHPVKPITTGEGGMITTNDVELYHKLKLFRSHGMVNNSADLVDKENEHGPWWYEQQVLGLNYRLCDIQAALGKNQIAKIDEFVEKRRNICLKYDAAFSGINHCRLFHNDPAQRARSGHHLYILRIDYKSLGTTRTQFMTQLRERGIYTQVHYIPVYKQPYHRAKFPNASANYSVSEEFYQECLSIPCFPSLTEDESDFVIATLKELMTK